MVFPQVLPTSSLWLAWKILISHGSSCLKELVFRSKSKINWDTNIFYPPHKITWYKCHEVKLRGGGCSRSLLNEYDRHKRKRMGRYRDLVQDSVIVAGSAEVLKGGNGQALQSSNKLCLGLISKRSLHQLSLLEDK